MIVGQVIDFVQDLREIDHLKDVCMPLDSVSLAPHTTRLHFKETFDGLVVEKDPFSWQHANRTLQGVKIDLGELGSSACLPLPHIMPRKLFIITEVSLQAL